MSKRSQEKRLTTGARTLKFLREQAGLSIRMAGSASGLSGSLVAHLEQGRMDIHERHLRKLLPVYQTTAETFQMFASGGVAMPQNLRGECMELVQTMSLDQLRTAHPVLKSLSDHK